ncbi:chorismate mutase [Francisella adeliensis]|uniref:chorismate mutase n=1 Tax=Francisella adeliensis TaxID=2007306 RepID=A0A2Z4XWH5_9GAMM|nr:chorismate mutase [Francisella adeliensis]AXA33214.1 chorismate mutase [Francisella adeliensis]MBK2085065.1 chorismate mutase [Francisella adeliensis]MBK2096944.1 chorismate mutase [Francisella adeliensis]QIW11442.1 chorismate mutase [Francisella adeliensis]QIW13317.1 chorismate mutase [Francisella adeliensis]
MQRSIRGATTINNDSKELVIDATIELLNEIISSNSVDSKDIVNIIFTTTNDISSEFPAVAARKIGLTTVPLLDCQQMKCKNSLALCIRVMLTYNTNKTQEDIQHIYLRKAKNLRPDLLK